jgi:hypothetical protein
VTTLTAPREGLIISASQVEQATLATLLGRLEAYGAALAAQEALDAPPTPPRSYTCASGFDHWVEDQLPAVVVASPGLVPGSLEPRGGFYSVVFGLVVGVYVSAATEAATHRLVRLWAAAVRACLLQSPALGGLCSELVWLAESYDDRPVDERRSWGVGTCAFEVRVDDVLDTNAGPLVNDDPTNTDPWTTVQTTSVEVDRLDEGAA